MFGGPGVIFIFLFSGRNRAHGVLFWVLMLIGCGILLVLISREWYARKAVGYPGIDQGFAEFVYPYSWSGLASFFDRT